MGVGTQVGAKFWSLSCRVSGEGAMNVACLKSVVDRQWTFSRLFFMCGVDCIICILHRALLLFYVLAIKTVSGFYVFTPPCRSFSYPLSFRCSCLFKICL